MLNTVEDKDKVNPDFIELYENDYFTIYEQNENDIPQIHTLVYKWNKSGVLSWLETVEDICKVLKEDGYAVVATTPLKSSTAIVRIANRAGFNEVADTKVEDQVYTIMVREL